MANTGRNPSGGHNYQARVSRNGPGSGKVEPVLQHDNTELEARVKQLEKAEPWLDKHWRNVSAMVYLIICLYDFIIMPTVIHIHNMDVNHYIKELVATTDKQHTLAIIDRMETEEWQPLTLRSGGLFHVSFGAILTGAVLMRGAEKKLKEKKD